MKTRCESRERTEPRKDLTNERTGREREGRREGKRKNESVREKTSEPVDLESGVNARGVVNFPIVPFPTMPAAHSRRAELRMPGRHARPPEMARPRYYAVSRRTAV